MVTASVPSSRIRSRATSRSWSRRRGAGSRERRAEEPLGVLSTVVIGFPAERTPVAEPPRYGHRVDKPNCPGRMAPGRATMPPMSGPMNGMRVVELGVWVAGPSCAGILADWGAEVVKIEPPEGDPFRGLAATATINGAFELDNRGKRSMAL